MSAGTTTVTTGLTTPGMTTTSGTSSQGVVPGQGRVFRSGQSSTASETADSDMEDDCRARAPVRLEPSPQHDALLGLDSGWRPLWSCSSWTVELQPVQFIDDGGFSSREQWRCIRFRFWTVCGALLSLSGCLVRRHWEVVDIERAGELEDCGTVDSTCRGGLMGNGSAFAGERHVHRIQLQLHRNSGYLLRLDRHRWARSGKCHCIPGVAVNSFSAVWERDACRVTLNVFLCDFLGPSMANSCGSSRAGGAGVGGSFTPR